MDVSQRGQKVAVILHCFALVPAFKKRAASFIALVVAVDVPGAQPAHDFADRLTVRVRAQQQVQVIGHEAVGKQAEIAQALVLA